MGRKSITGLRSAFPVRPESDRSINFGWPTGELQPPLLPPTTFSVPEWPQIEARSQGRCKVSGPSQANCGRDRCKWRSLGASIQWRSGGAITGTITSILIMSLMAIKRRAVGLNRASAAAILETGIALLSFPVVVVVVVAARSSEGSDPLPLGRNCSQFGAIKLRRRLRRAQIIIGSGLAAGQYNGNQLCTRGSNGAALFLA